MFGELKKVDIVYYVGNDIEYGLTKNLFEAVDRYKAMDGSKQLNMHIDDVAYSLEWE